jgi:hypothetical protein
MPVQSCKIATMASVTEERYMVYESLELDRQKGFQEEASWSWP